MIMQLIESIRRSMEAANGSQEDPEAAADLLETGIGAAVDMDGAVLLSLAPESIADIMAVSGTDPRVAEYVGRSLFLEASYLERIGRSDTADLRCRQARALADAYGFILDETLGGQAAMEAFLTESEGDAAFSGEGSHSVS
jgi:hypothetical protein